MVSPREFAVLTEKPLIAQSSAWYLQVLCLVLTLTASIFPPALGQQYINTRADQSPTKASTTAKPSFDVISIRPSRVGGNWFIGVSQNEYHAAGIPLWQTLLKAYFPSAYHSRDLIKNAPAWVWSDPYDIVGKVDQPDLAAWNHDRMGSPLAENTLVQAMIQGLLVDRCKIAVHRQPGLTQGFELVITNARKFQQQMSRSKPLQPLDSNLHEIPEGGKVAYTTRDDGQQLTFVATSLKSLAAELSILRVSPVIDRTGIPGTFNFILNPAAVSDSPDDSVNGTGRRGWRLDELGLGLRPTKIPVSLLIVDHIDRPSMN